MRLDVNAMLEKVAKTPWKDNGLTKEQKEQKIEKLFTEIMETLGLDLEDDSLKGTPKRVAKMYVREYFHGLLPENFPKITAVKDSMSYGEVLSEQNITVNSNCEHHFVVIVGKAHIAYKCKEKVLGLSKFNRIVDYFSRRPQIQERLTKQIYDCLVFILETEDVAVVIDGVHMCVKTRGVIDGSSITRTSQFGGIFKNDPDEKMNFLNSIPKLSEVRLN